MDVKKRFLKERVWKTNCGTACRMNRSRQPSLSQVSGETSRDLGWRCLGTH